MRKRKSQEEPTQVVRFEIEDTITSAAYIEVPADVLGDPEKEQAIVTFMRAFSSAAIEDDEFVYSVDKLDSSSEPDYRAVQSHGCWYLEPKFQECEPKRSLGTLHSTIVNHYDGVEPLEYSFAPCLSENEEIGKAVAYYCDGLVVLMVLWRESWEVAVLEGFDRQYPIIKPFGTIPMECTTKILQKNFLDDTIRWKHRIDEDEAYEAMIKAGMPSKNRSNARSRLADDIDFQAPKYDTIVTPKTILADDPDAFFARDESTDSDAG